MTQARGKGKPTLERALEIHRYVAWPPETSLQAFKAIRAAGDALKKENPQFLSFLIIGSRTKGTGRHDDQKYSDVDLIPVFRTLARFGTASNDRAHASKIVKPQFDNPLLKQISPHLLAPIYADNPAITPTQTALLFLLATHPEIDETRRQVIREKRAQKIWLAVQLAYADALQPDAYRLLPDLKWRHKPPGGEVDNIPLIRARHAKFGLPPLEKMEAWLDRFKQRAKKGGELFGSSKRFSLNSYRDEHDRSA